MIHTYFQTSALFIKVLVVAVL